MKRVPKAGLMVFALHVAALLVGCSKEPSQPPDALSNTEGSSSPAATVPSEPPLPEAVFLSIQSAWLQNAPAIGAERVTEAGEYLCGARFDVLAREGHWFQATTEGGATGWIHRALAAETLDGATRISQAGFAPSVVAAVYDANASTQELAFFSSSYLAASQDPSGSNIASDVKIKMYAGDGVWVGKQLPDNAPELPLESFGIATPLTDPEPGMLHVFDGVAQCRPRDYYLEEDGLRPKTRVVEGFQAFLCPKTICPQPQDMFWVHALGGLIVADSRRGIIGVELDLIRGCRQTFALARDGQEACMIGAHDGKLLMGWRGEPSTVVSGRLEGQGGLTNVVELTLPAPPVSHASFRAKNTTRLYLGLANGKLLTIDMDVPEVLATTDVGTQPVSSIEIGEKTMWVGCEDEGLHIYDLAEPDMPRLTHSIGDVGPSAAFTRGSGLADNMAVVAAVTGGVEIREGATGELSDSGISRGGNVAAKPAFCIVPGTPQGGMVFRSKEWNDFLVVGHGMEGASLYVVNGQSEVSFSRHLPMPCTDLAIGKRVAAWMADNELWFVSLSELIPDNFTNPPNVIDKVDNARIENGSINIVSARASGISECKPALPFSASPQWDSGFTTRQMVLVQQGDTFLAIGDYILGEPKSTYFQPGMLISVGRGGIKVKDRSFKAGDIFQIDPSGNADVAGRWRGFVPAP